MGGTSHAVIVAGGGGGDGIVDIGQILIILTATGNSLDATWRRTCDRSFQIGKYFLLLRLIKVLLTQSLCVIGKRCTFKKWVGYGNYGV